MRKQKIYPVRAFTLIELLVVIAIIGLLSSIVLVSIKTTREKAQRAAVQQFASQVYHAVGAYAVGIWNFDEGTDNTPITGAQDSSGYNNNGTCSACPIWQCEKIDTPSGQGCSLFFNGSTHYINTGNNSILKVHDKSFTLEAWIKPASNISTGGRYTVMAFYSPGWMIDLPDDVNIEGYRFYNGSANYKYTPSGNLISLEWTHLVVTRDINIATNQLKMYLNGGLKGTWTMVTVVDSGTNSLNIGRRSSGDYFFNGFIDDVRIYNEALTQAQVQKLFAEGAKKRGLLTENQ